MNTSRCTVHIFLHFFFFCFLLFSSYGLQAEVLPKRTASDPHVQAVLYDPNQVYRVTNRLGYTTAISFEPEEKILSVNVGDSSSWLVTVQNDVINLKAVREQADTNMNVVTTQRNYQFFLKAISNAADVKDTGIFLLRFRYPGFVADKKGSFNEKKKIQNTRYSAQGNSAIAPRFVFDDGKFTYLSFSGRRHIPAIFSVDADGNETLVNYHLQGDKVVVETVANQLTLRDGNLVASLFNNQTH